MGKQDDELRWYLNKDYIFADLCNGVLYNGKKVIFPHNLAEVQKNYQESLQDRRGRKSAPRRERDIARLLCREEGFVLIAIENQGESHLCMPLRCLEYDVEDLLKQLRRMKRHYKKVGGLKPGIEYLSGIKVTDRFIPTITLVLFHGTGKWTAATRLQELLDLTGTDETLRKFLMDYHLHVVELTMLDEMKFETGLRELIGMMKRRDSKKDMQIYCRENAERFKNMDDDTYDLICTMLHIRTLNVQKEKCRDRQAGGINMCKAFDDWAKEEREKGEKRGEKRGERQAEKRFGTLIDRLMKDGRIDDVKKAATCLSVRKRLYQEYKI
ncbi:MAG: Rpn family recombination-promoting nuclease/putative transposase [Eubacteriales bacterium]|nr:Rpn family recombination-promoting nuclease/putative transposase [Eubacteriales bacterium]